MEKEVLRKLKEWQEFNKSVSDMYLRISSYEQHNHLGTGYKRLKSLLPDAIRIERRLFDDIGINKNNYKEIEESLLLNMRKITAISNGKKEDLYLLRGLNLFENVLLFEYNNFRQDSSISNIFDIIASTQSRDQLYDDMYGENYQTQLITNYIQMVNRYISELDDEDVINYLIYLRYMLVSTTPNYEKNYINFNQNFLPTIDFIKTFPETPGYSPSVLKEYVRHSLEKDIKDDAKALSRVTDVAFPYSKKFVYRILALNKARLISLKDKNFIDAIAKNVDENLNKDGSHEIVNKLIGDMFFDAYEIIKKDYYALKRVGK